MLPRTHARLGRALALAACALALLVLPAATAGAAQPGVVLPNAGLTGGQLERLQASRARHVRIFTSWRVLEPLRGELFRPVLDQYDATLHRLKAIGIRAYLVVVQTPSWVGAGNAPP